MTFIIYGKENCVYCDSAKHLLTQKGLDFTYLMMGVDYTREELLELAPEAKSMPQIWIDTEVAGTRRIRKLGGHSDLVEFLKERNEIQDLLDSGKTVRVTFTKADGSIREMLCTKNHSVISERFVAEEKKTDRVYKQPEGVVQVFDLEKNGWRSFRLDSVQSYEVAEAV